jgi:hypothetical protein
MPPAMLSFSLAVAKEAKSIRVASQVLTAASNFFVDLFAANIRENKLTFGPQSPKRVPTMDDDSQAMLDLCSILHHPSGSVKVSSRKASLDPAFICAKYDCIAAARLLMSTQLDKQPRILKDSASPTESATAPPAVLDIMGLAYFFDLPEHSDMPHDLWLLLDICPYNSSHTYPRN